MLKELGTYSSQAFFLARILFFQPFYVNTTLGRFAGLEWVTDKVEDAISMLVQTG